MFFHHTQKLYFFVYTLFCSFKMTPIIDTTQTTTPLVFVYFKEEDEVRKVTPDGV